MKLLKSYFNFRLKLKLFKAKDKYTKELKTFAKRKLRMSLRKKLRMSTKKVFVGKGDFKHTNDKVIITFYIYNAIGMFLQKNLQKLSTLLLYPKFPLKEFINEKNSKHKQRIIIPYNENNKLLLTYNRLFSYKEFLFLCFKYCYYSFIIKKVNKISSRLIIINNYFDSLNNLIEKGILNNGDKLIIFNKINKYTFNFNYILKLENILVIFSNFYNKEFNKYNKLLLYNKIKFSNYFLSKLVFFITKMYNKEVELNIVNLKKMHLNSDIFTQIVSLKLKNRKNMLYKVLKSSLYKVKLPIFRKINERKPKFDTSKLLTNKIRNNTVVNMFTNYNKDPLNSILFKFFDSNNISLKYDVIKSLKHVDLRGIRLEAKGRLTRKFTASRSRFKMISKGGLKNVESSFGKLPTIMLRGIVKSNIQYSVINAKNRNGAFGVKG